MSRERAPAEPALAARDLAVHFGGVAAVDGIDLAVPTGETRAVIGPNGAGKTSLFDLLSGHLAPSRGSVHLFGRDVTDVPAHRRSQQGLSRTFQLSNLFPGLSVLDNVALAVVGDDPRARRRFWQPASRVPGVAERAMGVLEQFDLADVSPRRVEELGHGQQRVLEIAMAVAGDPRVLLLDEPTAGVSRADAEALTRLIAALPAELTLLLVEHDMEVAFSLADRVTVMVDGRELVTGRPDEVRGDDRVIVAYLGTSRAGGEASDAV